MPSPMIKKVSKTLNIPLAKVEKMYKDAESEARKNSDDFNYGLVTHIFKNKLSDSQLKKLGWVKGSFNDLTNGIEYITISKSVVKAGKASEALVVLSGILDQLDGIVTGEEALLSSAPDNIKSTAKSLVNGMKKLIYEVNTLVDVNKKPEPSTQEKEVPIE